ncbi:transglycosylase SLT domain-containing protein [uncultured Pseudoteredinibacter sp.]|uniref:transglycosylase SLT domain-containing protein n=1 Tax=uncultured Pseudoteredinibacter sp. TaxID=1641701 RepID=UPI00260C53A0|nr:transglycosylase SLT domain-containing protein [uncultured Pseudoteredinibacter sp.]
MSAVAISVLSGVMSLGDIEPSVESIPYAYLAVAESHQVPADLLFSIALAESGRPFDNKSLPWPWALNIHGLPVYCQTEKEALKAIETAIQREQQLDIGLMQISWRWQQHRFESFQEALIPMRNLQAGAEVLKEQYEHSQDWWVATGRYHDPGQDAESLASAEAYRERVKRIWAGRF